jgi:hypothetical protein
MSRFRSTVSVVSCDALRAGEQTINISVDPERAAALIAKFKVAPGVRRRRLDQRHRGDGALDPLSRRRLARRRQARTGTSSRGYCHVLSKTLAAKSSSSAWNANTGKLKLTFKRPSQIFPALGLTETVEVTALVAPDKPGASDRLMLWISNPVFRQGRKRGPKLNLAEESSGDEEGDQKDDNGSVDALAKEFKGQRWDRR